LVVLFVIFTDLELKISFGEKTDTTVKNKSYKEDGLNYRGPNELRDAKRIIIRGVNSQRKPRT